MKLVSDTGDFNHLQGLFPFWMSNDPELFSMDNVLVHQS